MTLILAVHGLESIWLLADRRLSFKGLAPKDDACKVMRLETTDSTAILGYAGLGATALGTQPADWMSAVLRGRELPLEQSLTVLAEAMKRQFPRHMIQTPGILAHNVLITAFVGGQPRLYTIDLVLRPNQKRLLFRCTRHIVQPTPTTVARTPRFGIAGTGALYLSKNRKWMRGILQVVRASDRCQVSPYAVADHLAELNYEVHLGVTDKTVGPRCVVVWQHREEGVHKGGGGHQFYTGATRDSTSASFPTISRGMDIGAIVGVMIPHVAKMFQSMRAGQPVEDLDGNKINAELACLPAKPDENLS